MAKKKQGNTTKPRRKRVKKVLAPLDLLEYDVVYLSEVDGEPVHLSKKKHSELLQILDMVHPEDYWIFPSRQVRLEQIREYEREKQRQRETAITALCKKKEESLII